jgi:hypothetical protein
VNYMGKEYTEVKDRIVEFLASYPNGSIHTIVEWHSPDFSAVCVKATVHPAWIDEEYYFTGLAYEEKGKGVNEDAWVENCETSAVGRALANMNIGVQTTGQRPSAEEMKKVTKSKTVHPTIAAALAPFVPPTSDETQAVITEINSMQSVDGIATIMDNVKVIHLAGKYTEAEFEAIRAAANSKAISLKKGKK